MCEIYERVQAIKISSVGVISITAFLIRSNKKEIVSWMCCTTAVNTWNKSA